MKKKILYMSMWDSDATFYYRLSVLKYINSPDLEIERRPYQGEITWSTLQQYHVIILERPSGNDDLSIIKLAKQAGVKVITDWDDDCLHLPVIHPMWHYYQQCKKDVMECLALSDEVWVSTASLKKAYSLLNTNIHVIPNAHNDYLQPVDKKKPFNPRTKKAFWRGGGSHEADVYDVAASLVKTINKNKKWQFQFIGCRFIYLELHCNENYTPVSQMALMQYFDYMRDENPNVVFHPLQNNRFNAGKSSIAWLEATYCGAAFFGNTDLPEFNKDCILPLTDLQGIDKLNGELEQANNDSWQLITETLLLSKINQLRTERMLAI